MLEFMIRTMMRWRFIWLLRCKL